MSTDYYNWSNENPNLSNLLEWGGPLVGAFGVWVLMGSEFGPIGAVIGAAIGAVFVVLYWAADQFFADLWNDPTFVDLWENMEVYLDQLVEGYDSEEEFANAFCEMAIYLLQKEYGENWREHAPPALLYYYDNVMQEEEQSDDDSEAGNSSSV